MMSGKDFLNRHVLSWRQKVYSDWEDVTSSDRAFQVFGPATGKAYSVWRNNLANFSNFCMWMYELFSNGLCSTFGWYFLFQFLSNSFVETLTEPAIYHRSVVVNFCTALCHSVFIVQSNRVMVIGNPIILTKQCYTVAWLCHGKSSVQASIRWGTMIG